MTDQTNMGNDSTHTSQPDEHAAGSSVNRGMVLLLILIITFFIWYILADRFTPYTGQARIQGYIVGVAPKVAGKVTSVWVKNNTRVRQGEPLFEVDPEQYQIAFEKAKFDLETAQRQVYAGDAAVVAARANLDAALANEEKARKDHERLQQLRKEDPGTISLRRLEVATATLGQARAQVAAARANIQQAIEQKGGENEESNAILKAAQNTVDKAALDLKNTVTVSDTRGIITDLRTEVGQYAATGNPVMTLIALEDVWITAEFSENNLGHMSTDVTVDIVFDAVPGRVFSGKVRSIGIGVSADNSNSSPGVLPSIKNDRDWLRQEQRFPVIIDFDPFQDESLLQQIRLGGQTTVIAYNKNQGILAGLGRGYIRLISWLSYIY